LTRGANKCHIARAALEGIAFQTHDVLHAMQDDSGIKLAELRVDGGATRNELLMQIRSRVPETTALGAAYLAGLGVGIWKDRSEIAAQWEENGRFEPGPDQERMQAHISDWNKAIERTLL
ncbi:FGGY-family carbohydrate kinase, partial [Verrucomicrobiales bacterium]|nr:FGGY-family carbohydrate kinase [Verrucomicrobiales bacterium]